MKIISHAFSVLKIFLIAAVIATSIPYVTASADTTTKTIYNGANYTMEVGETAMFYNPTSVSSFSFWARNWTIKSGSELIENSHETNSSYITITACKPGKVTVDGWVSGSEPITNYGTKYNAITKKWESYTYTTYSSRSIDIYFNITITERGGTTNDSSDSGETTSDPSDSGETTNDLLGSVVSTYGSTVKITGANTVKYLSCDTSNMKNYTIPSTVKIENKKYKVTAIGKGAFKNCKALKEFTVGKNIETIESNAFSGCCKLKTIKILSTKLKFVGKNALKGIHKKARIRVSGKKLKKYNTLLRNRGQAKSVKIEKR